MELWRPASRPAAGELNARVVDFGAHERLLIGRTDDLKPSAHAHTRGTRQEPRGDDHFVPEQRRALIDNDGPHHCHAAVQRHTGLDRQSQCARVTPGRFIEPANVVGIVDVPVLVDLIRSDGSRVHMGMREVEEFGRQQHSVGPVHGKMVQCSEPRHRSLIEV